MQGGWQGSLHTPRSACRCRLQPLEVAGFGLPRLLQLSGQLITDKTPEARDAAKRLVGLLSAAFADAAVQQQLDVQVRVAAEQRVSCAASWGSLAVRCACCCAADAVSPAGDSDVGCACMCLRGVAE